MLGGEYALASLCTESHAVVLDVSKTSFWVWFLIVADYTCTSTVHPTLPISRIWDEAYKGRHLRATYGTVLRKFCLGELFTMDYRMRNLLDDPALPYTEAV